MLGPIDFANRQLSKTAFRPFEKFPFATAQAILSPASSSFSPPPPPPPPPPSSSSSLPLPPLPPSVLPPTSQSLYAPATFPINDTGSRGDYGYQVYPNQFQVGNLCAESREYDDRLLRQHFLASMLPYTLPQELLSRLLPAVQISTPSAQPVASSLMSGLVSPPPPPIPQPPPPPPPATSAVLQVYPEFPQQMSASQEWSRVQIETGMGPQEGESRDSAAAAPAPLIAQSARVSRSPPAPAVTCISLSPKRMGQQLCKAQHLLLISPEPDEKRQFFLAYIAP
ncbi:unnamed protein product [Schistocephalus solidus]|uniref:Uncharacterized protein n=1 Tax=Schistocephalus solidus TaxID=70667 RepID=A0A183TBQ5_SCHSO|nr:unnamed protein product [Schistocephalus solidus]